MLRKRHPEEIVAELRQVDVQTGQAPVVGAVRAVGVTTLTYYRSRRGGGGPTSDRGRKLSDLEAEDSHLLKAVADLTLDELTLAEAATGNF